jgi:hypothetical protein
VHDDGQLPDPGREALIETRARVLELREHALDVRRIALVVARDEGVRCGLEPGQAYAGTPSELTIPVISSDARSNSSSDSTGVPSNGSSRLISSHDRQPP